MDEVSAIRSADEYQPSWRQPDMVSRPMLFCAPKATQRPCSASAVMGTQHEESPMRL